MTTSDTKGTNAENTPISRETSIKKPAAASPSHGPKQREGSLHTAYYPPQSTQQPQPRKPSLPPYDTSLVDYRPPEPVPSSPHSIPDLVEATTDTWGGNAQPSWDADAPSYNNNAWQVAPYKPKPGQYTGWGNSTEDEAQWWDKSAALKGKPKPGPGCLPSKVMLMMHTDDHAPIGVSVTPPDILPDPPKPSTSSTTSSASTSPTRRSHSRSTSLAHSIPTREEVLVAVPHPHAYFCSEHLGWALIYPSPNANLPPLIPDPTNTRLPLPDDTARRSTANCLDQQHVQHSYYTHDQTFSTHHFHHYPDSVRGSSLSPPFVNHLLRPNWEISLDKEDRTTETSDSDLNPDDDILLDLFVCCQCQVHILATPSDVVIPAVIPKSIFAEFRQDRMANPALGKNGSETYILALETILKIIENLIWKLKTDAVKVKTQNALTVKVGWSPLVQTLFESLGFRFHPEDEGHVIGGRLSPPDISTSHRETSANRAKLLRAWVELGAIVQDHRKRYSRDLRNMNTMHKLWVKAEVAREDIQRAIGAHPDQMPRNSKADPSMMSEADRRAWDVLGTTMSTHSADSVEFAYTNQVKCHPVETVQYFTFLSTIRQWAHDNLDPSYDSLTFLYTAEQSKGRWTSEDLRNYTAALNLLDENGKVRNELTGVSIRDAWRAKNREVNEALKALDAPDGGVVQQGAYTLYPRTKDDLDQERNRLKEAYRVVAESTGDVEIMKIFEDTMKMYRGMDVAEAYHTMDAPETVDEDMLVMLYNIRIQDAPLAESRMRQAMLIIAEDRDSARLRAFAETGRDAGPPPPASARFDWPRGLQQLGNTCYLNSLLQYFYTIKDLRHAILDTKADPTAALSDEDLKQNRIGGRVVSRREVERSKQFINHLSSLFFELAWTELPSVKPEIQLAKLALVTSKDEEEEAKSDKSEAAGTSSSLQSGSTLVDEPMPLTSVESGNGAAGVPTGALPNEANAISERAVRSQSPPSVLGKRPTRGSLSLERERRHTTSMELDTSAKESLEKDGFVMLEKSDVQPSLQPRRAATMVTASLPASSSAATVGSEGRATDVEMGELASSGTQPGPVTGEAEGLKPPPLPPRKKAATQNDSVMMFGKQHDVSECMDNCMFQIEAALKFDFGKSSNETADGAKSSVVKNLFYGKQIQRIQLADDALNPSGPLIHEKEDLFSQLLVNVADEGYDLYDGLAGYFDDTVEFKGKQAKMETAIVDLPPLLQIQLQRVQFNRDTMQAYKSNAYMKFEESLFMDRFLASASPEKIQKGKAIQAQLNVHRERIQALSADKGGPFDDPLANTLAFLTSQDAASLPDVDEDLISELKSERGYLKAEMMETRAAVSKLKREMEDLWKDERTVEYELCSVFIHRGSSPSFGHYFFYSRNLPDKPDDWFKYNDQDVSAVPKSEVLADTTGSTANPYMLVFARKGMGLIDSVHRTNVETFGMEN